MVNRGWRRKIILAVLAVSFLSLPIACKSADEKAGLRGALSETATAGPTPTPAATPTPTPTPVVEVTVNKAVYRVSERVRFTITNYGDRSVYYREGGCTWPFIVRFEDGNEVQLAINITEEEIPTGQLAAGESLSCDWNQIAWWNTDATGIMRFRTMNGSHQVPPGQYQIKFPYAFEEEHIHSPVLSIIAESQIFTIE